MKIYDSFQNLKEHHQVIFAVIIGTSIIIFWRGAWVLADQFLGFDPVITIISTIIALVILIISGELMDLLD